MGPDFTNNKSCVHIIKYHHTNCLLLGNPPPSYEGPKHARNRPLTAGSRYWAASEAADAKSCTMLPNPPCCSCTRAGQLPVATGSCADRNSCATRESDRGVSAPEGRVRHGGQREARQRQLPCSKTGFERLLDPEGPRRPSAELHIASSPAHERHIHVIHVRRYSQRRGRRQRALTFSRPCGRQRKRSAQERKRRAQWRTSDRKRGDGVSKAAQKENRDLIRFCLMSPDLGLRHSVRARHSSGRRDAREQWLHSSLGRGAERPR